MNYLKYIYSGQFFRFFIIIFRFGEIGIFILNFAKLFFFSSRYSTNLFKVFYFIFLYLFKNLKNMRVTFFERLSLLSGFWQFILFLFSSQVKNNENSLIFFNTFFLCVFLDKFLVFLFRLNFWLGKKYQRIHIQIKQYFIKGLCKTNAQIG